MDREEVRRRIRDYKEAERAAERAAMPMSVEQLRGLLETLNAQLKSCDHSLKLTRGFLASEELPEEPVVAWLGDHGGFCDCEVLANVEDVLELVSPQALGATCFRDKVPAYGAPAGDVFWLECRPLAEPVEGGESVRVE